MIGMTRDALCVNVNSLVSALAQRSTRGRPPRILNVILLFDRVIVTSANHGWNANDLAFHMCTVMMRGDTVLFSPSDSYVSGKLLTSDSYVTQLGPSW